MSDRDVDRIGKLPDPLLHHLLSFVPTQYVVRTCVLSKRWKDVWFSTQSFDFDESSFPRATSFSKFVDFVLLSRPCGKIEKLRLKFGNTYLDQSRLNVWIAAAVNHNIQSLCLVISGIKSLWITPSLFTCESLRTLKLDLNSTNVALPVFVCLPSVEFLYLKSAKSVNYKLANILISACSNLKNLIIENTGNPSLVSSFLNITAPHLKNLTIKAFRQSTVINLFAPSLTKVMVNTVLVDSDLSNIMEVFKNAQSVSLGSDFIESCAAELEEVRELPTCLQVYFRNLKWLELQVGNADAEYIVVKSFLMNSPNIETLILESYVSDCEISTYIPKDMWLDCRLSKLKLVRIKNFLGGDTDIEFVKFLLKSAIVLEKMIVVMDAHALSGNASKERKRRGLMKIGEMLLMCPRASSSVGILFI